MGNEEKLTSFGEPSRRPDMSHMCMVVQAVIIFILLSAFVLYVFSPRSLAPAPSSFTPPAVPSYIVNIANSALFSPVSPSQPAAPVVVYPPPPPYLLVRQCARMCKIKAEVKQSPSQPAAAPAIAGIYPRPPLRPVVNHPEEYQPAFLLDVKDAKQPSADYHSHTMLGKFRKAAVVSDHGICSEIGRSILTRGGNAVDASIATLICVGATNPQSSGIGGGFFMQFYEKETGTCTTINAREKAPNNTDVKEYEKEKWISSYGWKAIGVPGEIKGFWRAFKKFGSGRFGAGRNANRVAWKDLLVPTIKLCREGIPVSEYLASILTAETAAVYKTDEIREMFMNPATKRFYKEGEIMRRPKLAKTLQRLADAKDPVVLFYEGDMADTIIKEIQENGGYMTKEDLEDFEPKIHDGLTSSISSSLTQCGLPPPSGWIVTQLISSTRSHVAARTSTLTLLGDPIEPYKDDIKRLIAELTDPSAAKKFAAKIRDEGPQDDKVYGAQGYVKEDHGTSHVSVIDEQGNAVAVTSSINLWLGARVASSLGIIWNDQMDDFGVPGVTNGFGFEPSKENLIAPGKIPMSSMSPTIIYSNKDNQVRVVVGTTGGSKIIQGVASVVVRSLLFNQTIKEAIDAPQIFNQMQPDIVQYEKDFTEHIIAGLRAKGHTLQEEKNMRSTTHALFVDEATKYIYANSDKRSAVHMHPDGY
ncbi:hypothetical protein PRIPAC_75254 [Pristionchus pacificus]|uniref:Uncharacterized protein n=1 Tax=Pristionchus pacificus TaxID=54126 RepID=A0A2A6C1F8_PRIPA|nr:hypothetical protein PRIPAC_75254 [Pristionchus pacificus]|eukprot:PDM71871.1 hypothetical protein PRIPAC_38278 [Pristionchus pacificus]